MAGLGGWQGSGNEPLRPSHPPFPVSRLGQQLLGAPMHGIRVHYLELATVRA